MSDFIAKIKAQLDMGNAESQMSSFLNKYQNKPMKIKVDLDTSGSDFDKQLKAKMEASGKAASTSFSNGFSAQNFKAETQKISKQMQKAQQDILTHAYDAKSSKMGSKMNLFSGQESDLLKQAENYKKIYDDTAKNLNRHFDSKDAFKLDDGQFVTSLKNMETAAKGFENTMTLVGNASSKSITTLEAMTQSNKMVSWLKNNTKAYKDYGETVISLSEKMKTATTQAEKNSLLSEFNNIKSEAQALGKTGKSWFDGIKDMGSQVAKYAGGFMSFYQGIQIAKQMVSAVYEIDTAMTNLYKVTDETDAKYSSFMKDAAKNSQDLGRSMSSYITQSSEWAKLGETIEDSAELAKVSSIYANVGEVDDATAVGDLITAMKSYNIEASESMGIVDQLNNLSNKYAVSAAGLGEGLKNSASAMSLQGNTLEQTLAILTGGGEITQNVGELGNMLKVGSMRLASMKGELSEIGEEYENINSVSKNQTEIYNMTKGQVDILDAENGKLKETYTILEEVAAAWDDISDLDKNDLAELMFGKQRANQGVAIIKAFQSGQIQKAYADALNSDGSAMEEQNRWMESLEAKTQQFQSAFQNLSNTTVDSDFLKGIVDGGTEAINVLTQIIDQFGIMTPLIGGLATGKGIAVFAKNFDQPQTTGCPCFPIFQGWVYHGGDYAIMAA